MNIEALNTKIAELRSEAEEKFAGAEEALERDDLDRAEAIKTEIEALYVEIAALEAELAELEQEAEPEDTPEEAEQEEERTEDPALEEEKPEARAEENIENKGEERTMTNEIVEDVIVNQDAEVRTNFQNFVMNNEIRDLSTESGAVVVPEYIGTQVKDLTEDIVSLDKYVSVESVDTKSGTKPVYNGDATSPLVSVDELAENPKVGVQPLTEVDYKVETYRGYIPVSREAIEDGIGAEALVKKILAEAVVNTRNAHILAVANTFAATTVSDLDGLKDLINVDLKPRHKKHILMSQSVYNTIDKLKDNNGQYLLQNSISATSGKQLFGMEVAVFEDELIGADTMYVGNFAEAVVLFDRSQYQAQWTSYMHFGECLMVAIRHQVKELNADAVRKVTFSTTPEA